MTTGEPSTDTLPYISLFTTHSQLEVAWCELKAYHQPLTECKQPYRLSHVQIDPRFQEKYMIIKVEHDAYYKINFLTDYFTEPARIRARRYNQPSSWSYWQAHGAQIQTNNPSWTLRNLREWLYKQVIEPSNFRLTVATALLDYFKPSSIFDPCAGHGDRAFAALSRSYVRSYLACEPNTLAHRLIQDGIRCLIDLDSHLASSAEEVDKLQKDLKGIHLASSAGEKKDVKHPVSSAKVDNYIKKDVFYIHNTPAEAFLQSWSEKHLVDLIFTSPPYGDTEIYCDESTQSIQRYPIDNGDAWYTSWLLPLFQRSWTHLRDGGHMAISINNVRDHEHKTRLRFSFTERLVTDLTVTCPDAVFLGTISYQDGKTRFEPIFIWQKKREKRSS